MSLGARSKPMVRRWSSNVQVENVTDPAKPLAYSYHVRIPGYAQRTGKRLILEPAFFKYGLPAVFTASTRKHWVNSPYYYDWLSWIGAVMFLAGGIVSWIKEIKEHPRDSAPDKV